MCLGGGWGGGSISMYMYTRRPCMQCGAHNLHIVPATYLYGRKFSREKTFSYFAVLEPPAKVFSSKFGCAIFNYFGFFKYSAKVFSLKSFLLYGTFT